MADALTTLSDRDLAIRVATDVLGWELWDEKDDYAGSAPICFAAWNDDDGLAVYCNDDPSGDVDRYLSPASDLSDFVAEVVPAMRAKGWYVVIYSPSTTDTMWAVTFARFGVEESSHHGYDLTNPARAGCLAALRALEQTP